MGEGSGCHYDVVLIVSHRFTRELVTAELARHVGIRVVGATAEPTVGVELASQQGAHVILIDGCLPEDSFFRALDALSSNGCRANGFIIASGVYEFQVQQALLLGAKGFFTYHDSIPEIISGIKTVAAGGYAVCNTLAGCVYVSPRGLRLSTRGVPTELKALTEREREILACIVNGDTTRDCALRLDLSESTVDNHKTRIMRKLNTHRTVDLVKLAIRKRLVPDW